MNFLTILFLSVIANHPQPDTQHIEGAYRLRGGHEMVAEFHFTAAGHFEFGFAYGAVDREANGSYTIDKGRIILHSDKTPGKDFTVNHAEHKGEGFTVQVSNPNPWFMQNVVCIFKKGDQSERQLSDDNGVVHSAMSECDSILVGHTLFPDVMTVIKGSHDTVNNHFELSLNPSLAYLTFKGITPRLDKDRIIVEMPWLFEMEQAVFEKVDASK